MIMGAPIRINYDHVINGLSKNDQLEYNVYFNDAVNLLMTTIKSAEKTAINSVLTIYHNKYDIHIADLFSGQDEGSIQVSPAIWRMVQTKFPEHIFRRNYPMIDGYHKKGLGYKLKNRFVFRVVSYTLGHNIYKREIKGMNRSSLSYFRSFIYEAKERENKELF